MYVRTRNCDSAKYAFMETQTVRADSPAAPSEHGLKDLVPEIYAQ